MEKSIKLSQDIGFKAMSRMDCPVSRAEHFETFKINENMQNQKIKHANESLVLVLESLFF